MSNQDLGRFFENEVDKNLKKYLRYTTILREKDVKANYGINNSSIDHLIISDNNIICIQSKWENSKASISKINHFLMGINNIHKKNNNKIFGGIYLSKLAVSEPSKEALLDNNIYTINIYDNDMDNIIEKLLEHLHFTYHIWSYDFDGCIIMR